MNEEQSSWRWADAHGAQNAIDESDLVSSLSSGDLPACTLVWRSGWGEWLPASQVGELAAALPPGQRERSVEPKLSQGMSRPPPAPLHKYNARLTREAAAKLLAKSGGNRVSVAPPAPPRPVNGDPRPSKVPPPFPGRAAIRSARPPPRGQLPPPPPPPPQRPPVPTLIEVAPPAVTGTLRPPAAVPPPPRAVPAVRVVEPEPEPFTGVVTTTTTPLPPLVTATPLPSIVITDKTEAAVSPPPAPAEAATFIAEPPQPTPPPWDSEAPTIAPAESEPSTTPSSMPPPRSSLFSRRRAPGASVLMIGLSGAAALLVLVIVVLLLTRSSSETPAPPAAAVPVAPAPAKSQAPRPKPPVCSLAAGPKRVAPAIMMGVPPYLARVPASERIAVGLAGAPTRAEGLTLDPNSLDAARTFDRAGTAPVVGVVPLTRSGQLSFAVDRGDARLKFARTIDAKVPFTVGINDQGVARSTGDAEPELIWPGEAGEEITEIRVASVDAVGHGVTFRRGGQSGKVLVGWLSPEGKAKTELTTLQVIEPLAGTPMIAANDEAILVAFAARADTVAKWGVVLGTAAHGQLPRTTRRLPIPPGGPGGEAISPAATGLPKGRWFLQWTEGVSGKRQVRGQLLDRDLAAAGNALRLSPESANSGQGVVWAEGDRVISMFLVSTGKTHELWAQSLSCR